MQKRAAWFRTLWALGKDTVNSCLGFRVIGLAAEAVNGH